MSVYKQANKMIIFEQPQWGSEMEQCILYYSFLLNMVAQYALVCYNQTVSWFSIV